jgi:hypothetical protein
MLLNSTAPSTRTRPSVFNGAWRNGKRSGLLTLPDEECGFESHRPDTPPGSSINGWHRRCSPDQACRASGKRTRATPMLSPHLVLTAASTACLRDGSPGCVPAMTTVPLHPTSTASSGNSKPKSLGANTPSTPIRAEARTNRPREWSIANAHSKGERQWAPKKCTATEVDSCEPKI